MSTFCPVWDFGCPMDKVDGQSGHFFVEHFQSFFLLYEATKWTYVIVEGLIQLGSLMMFLTKFTRS